jgi:hypothetical protein
MMPVESVEPDFKTSLRLDSRAPRAARHHVAQVDRLAPDLRDAVVLLTSELVTRAVAQCKSGPEEVELRVWMPHDVVRVELRARSELLRLPLDDRNAPYYDVMLLGQVADRWSIDTDQKPARMWFEIDRHVPKADPKVEPSAHAQSAPRRRRLVRRRRSADRAR